MSRKLICALTAVFALSLAMLTACTPESPPLKDNERSSAVSVQDKASDVALSSDEPSASDASSDEASSDASSADASENDTSGADLSSDEPSASDVPSDEASDDASGSSDGKLWDESMGDIKEAAFRYEKIYSTDYFKSDDEPMMKKLADALRAMRITGEADERVDDDTVILLYTAESRSGMLLFEHGNLIREGKAYTVEGFAGLQSVLDEIEQAYPEWKNKYDEWIHKLSDARLRIEEMTFSDAYMNGDLETRREMSLDLLHILENNGMIKKGSIEDSGDNISFTFDCSEEGVLGGIMLREFDPIMN